MNHLRSIWGETLGVTFESLLVHFSSFCVSVELGARPLLNPKLLHTRFIFFGIKNFPIAQDISQLRPTQGGLKWPKSVAGCFPPYRARKASGAEIPEKWGKITKFPSPGRPPKMGKNYRKITNFVFSESFFPFLGPIFPF